MMFTDVWLVSNCHIDKGDPETTAWVFILELVIINKKWQMHIAYKWMKIKQWLKYCKRMQIG